MTKEAIKKIYGIIIFAGAVFFLIQNYRTVGGWLSFIIGIISPFIQGGVIAFIVNIPMRFVENTFFKKSRGKGFVRPASIAITFLFLVFLVAAVMIIVIPQLSKTVEQVIASTNEALPRFKEWADGLLQTDSELKNRIDSLDLDMDKTVNEITSFIKNGAGSAFANAFSAASAVVSRLVSSAIGLVFACYILMDKENLARQISMLMDAALSEKACGRIKYIANKFSVTFSSFISCQCLEACILGLMFLVTLLITRMPYAFLISVLIAFTALIPVVGAFIGCVVGAFLILMENPWQALAFLVIFFVLQQIEGNLIYPKVVGGSVGLPSIWVLVAVTAGSSLMGVAGMLFFIPLTSVLYSLIKEWTYKRLEARPTD